MFVPQCNLFTLIDQNIHQDVVAPDQRIVRFVNHKRQTFALKIRHDTA